MITVLMDWASTAVITVMGGSVQSQFVMALIGAYGVWKIRGYMKSSQGFEI